MRDLVVIGAGGFGRETVDVVRAINDVRPTWNLLGVADDSPSPANLDRLAALGLHHLGGLTAIPTGVDIAVAVGRPAARAQIVATLADRDHSYPSLIHPTAVTGSEFRHGEGLIVLGGVSIGTNVTLRDHVHLNGHAVIGHDVLCHDFVSINPSATVSGECTVGARTLLGAASTVLQQLTVGSDVTVGAAACVTRSLPEGCTVVGVPAHLLEKDPTE